MAHEILISEEIGGTVFGMDIGVTAHSIKRELDAAGDADILVRINSPGGSVFEAAAIFNLLRDRGVDVSIDGWAASAASVIAMAGNRISMAENAIFMMHDPIGVAVGNASEIRKLGDVLDKVKGTIIDTYHGKSRLAKDKIDKMMTEETWLRAAEAKQAGFVDEVREAKPITNRFDPEQFGFKNFPKDWPPEPAPTPKLDAALEKFRAMVSERGVK